MSKQKQSGGDHPSGSSVGDDRIYESLEMGEAWLAVRWRFLLVVLLAVTAVIAIIHFNEVRAQGLQDRLWEDAAKLTQLHEITSFVRRNAGYDAAAPLALRASRICLEQKEFDQALQMADIFLKNYPKHMYTDLAKLLKAYSLEELGRVEEAKKMYMEVGDTTGATGMMARLEALRHDMDLAMSN